LGLSAALILLNAKIDFRFRRESAFLLLMVSLFATGSFVTLNSSETLSLARFKSLAEGGALRMGHYAFEELSHYYRDHGELDSAVVMLKEAIRVAPRSPRLQLSLGTLYEDLGRRSLAKKAYREALLQNPQFIDARYNLSLLFYSQGQNDSACMELAQLLQTGPGFVKARLLYGAARYRLGQIDKAKNEWERVLQVEPNNGTARYFLKMHQGEKKDSAGQPFAP